MSRLDVFGGIVSSRSAHAAGMDVICGDLPDVGEGFATEGTDAFLICHFLQEQPSHGGRAPVNPASFDVLLYSRTYAHPLQDVLDRQDSPGSSTAKALTVDGAELAGAEFHNSASGCFAFSPSTMP